NFFIVIPQLVAASLLGLLVTQLLGGEPIYALGLGAASFVCAAIATLFVTDVGDESRRETSAAAPIPAS
ncbi:MAG: MFS transporter, partial [Pseudomonadota bacterium]